MQPSNLDECFDALKIMLSYEDLDYIKNLQENDLCTLHHTLGRKIRNDWHLWNSSSPLNKFFNDMGIFHADDMSGIILISFWRKMLQKEIDLENQIKYYQDFWSNNQDS